MKIKLYTWSLGITAGAYHFQYILKKVLSPVPKNAPPKSPNDQLPSQISKTYSLHPNSPILWQSITKIIETHYIFIFS